ncbi:DUF2207 domain-containing protein [Patescibacteria group bacterium]
MKKLFAALFFVVFFASTAIAQAGWNFPSIDQTIEIQENGKIRVTETIVADFTQDSHRGIYREIPVHYTDEYGNPFNLRLKLLSITDENGNPHPIDKKGRDLFSDEYYIRIGDSDVWLQEEVTYVITYEVERALNYFGEHDELYWNIFSYWEVPVLKSTATVILPEEVDIKDLQAACFTGYYGGSESNCTAQIIDGKTIKYTGQQIFEPYDGFTIVAGFPKGLAAKPSILKKIWWLIIDNWSLLIPFGVFLFLYLKWWFTGRDPRTRDTIYPRYKAPESLTAIEVGTIVDESLDMRDITTVIIDWAVKGYIKIHEFTSKKGWFSDKKDYELELLKPYKDAPDIKPVEKDILDGIFGTKDKVKISALKYKFYKKIPNIKKDTYKGLVKDGYFVHNPENVRTTYYTIGGVLIGAVVFGGGLIAAFFGGIFLLSVIISGGLFFAFAKAMPRKTIKGAKAYYEILGLEEYIRTAEKDRIKFQEQEGLLFEKLLPYAMALNLADKWADAFKDIYKNAPDWFEAEDMSGFNANYLVNRLNNFSSHANTAFAASPRSSGGGSSSWGGGSGFSGGFSGGGFGGGGGGGW